MDRETGAEVGKARLPPRWFIETFWRVHRRIVRASGGRRGLWPPRPGKWGALQLTTTGRRSGEPRSVIIGYYEDGPNLVSMAMNGWGAAEPAWWLNLQADPRALAELAGGVRREVLARPAAGQERDRLWQRWRELDTNLDSYVARRPRETAVVVLEPRAEAERTSPRIGMEDDMRVEETIEIDRPPEAVFSYVSDIGNYPEWMAHVLEVRKDTPGPPQQGDTFTIAIKSVGRRFETPYERTSSEANRRCTDRALGGPIPNQSWHSTFEEVAGGTRLTRAVDAEPGGVLRLLEPLQKRAAGRQLREDLQTLKHLLEAR
jgi:deazaflavin-dependent oxidoreductase (nitroreductase family)